MLVTSKPVTYIGNWLRWQLHSLEKALNLKMPYDNSLEIEQMQ